MTTNDKRWVAGLTGIYMALGLFGLIQGCGTTPAGTAYKVEGTTIATVDTAMQGWADWVKAGHATQKQVDTVKAAYGKYYEAQTLAKSAVDVYLANKTEANSTAVLDATAAVATAQGDLLTLVQPSITPKGVK